MRLLQGCLSTHKEDIAITPIFNHSLNPLSLASQPPCVCTWMSPFPPPPHPSLPLPRLSLSNRAKQLVEFAKRASEQILQQQHDDLEQQGTQRKFLDHSPPNRTGPQHTRATPSPPPACPRASPGMEQGEEEGGALEKSHAGSGEGSEGGRLPAQPPLSSACRLALARPAPTSKPPRGPRSQSAPRERPMASRNLGSGCGPDSGNVWGCTLAGDCAASCPKSSPSTPRGVGVRGYIAGEDPNEIGRSMMVLVRGGRGDEDEDASLAGSDGGDGDGATWRRDAASGEQGQDESCCQVIVGRERRDGAGVENGGAAPRTAEDILETLRRGFRTLGVSRLPSPLRVSLSRFVPPSLVMSLGPCSSAPSK